MSNFAPSGQRPRSLLVSSIILAAIVSLAATAAHIASRSFRNLYEGFGAELPPLTQAVMGGLWAWALLAFAGVCNAVWVASTPMAPHQTIARMWIAVGILAVVAGSAMAVSLVALYLPFFRMGDVI